MRGAMRDAMRGAMRGAREVVTASSTSSTSSRSLGVMGCAVEPEVEPDTLEESVTLTGPVSVGGAGWVSWVSSRYTYTPRRPPPTASPFSTLGLYLRLDVPARGGFAQTPALGGGEDTRELQKTAFAEITETVCGDYVLEAFILETYAVGSPPPSPWGFPPYGRMSSHTEPKHAFTPSLALRAGRSNWRTNWTVLHALQLDRSHDYTRVFHGLECFDPLLVPCDSVKKQLHLPCGTCYGGYTVSALRTL